MLISPSKILQFLEEKEKLMFRRYHVYHVHHLSPAEADGNLITSAGINQSIGQINMLTR